MPRTAELTMYILTSIYIVAELAAEGLKGIHSVYNIYSIYTVGIQVPA